MEEFIETFHIDWKLMVAQLFNFGVVFLVFYLLAAKPLRKLMKKREELISKGVDDARLNTEILGKTQKSSEEILNKARVQANKLSEDSKKELETAKIAMLEEAKNQAKQIVDTGKKNLESEKLKMVQEAKNELASLAMLAAEKIMAEKINKK
ncbi:MAG: ATP synthase F0 subunit B [Patescibacteria group bacterium]